MRAIRFPRAVGRQLRRDDDDAAGGADVDMQVRLRQAFDKAGFFPEEDAGLGGEATHQMLGTLKDEFQPQMTEEENGMRAVRRHRSEERSVGKGWVSTYRTGWVL